MSLSLKLPFSNFITIFVLDTYTESDLRTIWLRFLGDNEPIVSGNLYRNF